MNEDKPIVVSGSLLLKVADRIAELDEAAVPFVKMARDMDTSLNDNEFITLVVSAGELRRLARAATKNTELTRRQSAELDDSSHDTL